MPGQARQDTGVAKPSFALQKAYREKERFLDTLSLFPSLIHLFYIYNIIMFARVRHIPFPNITIVQATGLLILPPYD